MEKEILLQELKKISDVFFNKKDYLSAGQINRAIDVIIDNEIALISTTTNNKTVFIVQGENLLLHGCFDSREKAEKFIGGSSTMRIQQSSVI